jgi:hypothetical protein
MHLEQIRNGRAGFDSLQGFRVDPLHAFDLPLKDHVEHGKQHGAYQSQDDDHRHCPAGPALLFHVHLSSPAGAEALLSS